MSGRPTPLATVLAALGTGHEWLYADEIRAALKGLGFDAAPQQVANWLRPLLSEDCPRFERRERGGLNQYTVTRFGRTEVFNKLPGMRRFWEADRG